jgi:hypothetical protein
LWQLSSTIGWRCDHGQQNRTDQSHWYLEDAIILAPEKFLCQFHIWWQRRFMDQIAADSLVDDVLEQLWKLRLFRVAQQKRYARLSADRIE